MSVDIARQTGGVLHPCSATFVVVYVYEYVLDRHGRSSGLCADTLHVPADTNFDLPQPERHYRSLFTSLPAPPGLPPATECYNHVDAYTAAETTSDVLFRYASDM